MKSVAVKCPCCGLDASITLDPDSYKTDEILTCVGCGVIFKSTIELAIKMIFTKKLMGGSDGEEA